MSSIRKTHYETLGVTSTSSPEEIRSAYRKLVLKHHPDHSSDPRSADILRRAIEAYEVLSDSARRKTYDALLEARARDAATTRAQEEKEGERGSQAWAAWARERDRHRHTEKEKGSLTQDLIRLSSLFSKSRFADAEELANKISQTSPKEPLPYAVLGDIARSRGDVPGAINMYARAVQADPRNQLYQHRYEELVHSQRGSLSKQDPRTPAQRAAPFIGYGITLVACVYVAVSSEAPIVPGLSLISTWTLGLVMVLFLSGVAAGASLSVAGKVDRFSAVSTTSAGRFSPAMALGTIAVVSYWAAATIYSLVGLAQNAFTYSTSRLLTAVGFVVCLASMAAWISDRLNPLQVFLWGGNLAYLGAMCGWMVADSLLS